MDDDFYGRYILTTGDAGKPSTSEWAFNKYIYESRFSQLAPILEIGPGRCAFVAQSSHIVGIDNAPMIVQRQKSAGLNVEVGSAYDIPFPDDYFHGVFSCWLLEHLAKPDQCMREVRRVLADGGYACMIVPSEKSLTRGFYDDFTHIRPYTRRSLAQLAVASGFDHWRVTPLFFTRFTGRVAKFLGLNESSYLSFFRFADLTLRRWGLVNKRNWVLEAWK